MHKRIVIDFMPIRTVGMYVEGDATLDCGHKERWSSLRPCLPRIGVATKECATCKKNDPRPYDDADVMSRFTLDVVRQLKECGDDEKRVIKAIAYPLEEQFDTTVGEVLFCAFNSPNCI